MNTLYAEVIGSVLAAGVLGLLCGWMLQRARAARTLKGTIATWEKRCNTLRAARSDDRDGDADADGRDAARLEALGAQLRSLKERNQELTEALAERDAELEAAHGDAIERNREHATVQQQLQTLLRRQDKAASSGARAALANTATTAASARDGDDATGSDRNGARDAATAPIDDRDVEAYIDRLGDRGEPEADTGASLERQGRPSRATRPPRAIAVAAVADVPAQEREARPSAGAAPDRRSRPEPDLPADADEATLDATELMGRDEDETATLVLDPLDTIDGTLEDDSTVAFDDATLARVRRRSYE